MTVTVATGLNLTLTLPEAPSLDRSHLKHRGNHAMFSPTPAVALPTITLTFTLALTLALALAPVLGI